MECDFQCTGAANEVVEKERGNVQQQVNSFHFFNKPRVTKKTSLPKLGVFAIKLEMPGKYLGGIQPLVFRSLVFLGGSGIFSD